MTSNRNLGPILAGIGCAVVTAAVVTGFFVVGGPGDARDQRFDNLTMQKIDALTDAAQCAYSWSGKTFETAEEVRAAADKVIGPTGDFPCRHFSSNLRTGAVGGGDRPENPGDVTYVLVDGNHIRVCGNFHRSYDPERPPPPYFGYAPPEFEKPRPAGRHCYDIELVTPDRDPAPAPVLPEPS